MNAEKTNGMLLSYHELVDCFPYWRETIQILIQLG